MIMARKAVQTIEWMQLEHDTPTFLSKSFEEVCSRYKRYKENSGTKMNALVAANEAELSPYLKKLAERSLAASGASALAYLHQNGLVDEATEHDIEVSYASNGAHH
jgi:monovalent cation:H+ antiporter, CPA1 family